MRIGETPTIDFCLGTVPYNDIDKLIITIKQNAAEFELTNDDVFEYDEGKNVVKVKLTEEQTLMLNHKELLRSQISAKLFDGNIVKGGIHYSFVDEVLREGAIDD